MSRVWYTNDEIADALERVAELLEAQHPPRGSSGSYRVEAFRRAAKTVREHRHSLIGILDADGLAGLERLPGVGASIASAIRELIETGHLRMLDRLEGQISPEDLFTTIPGIGEELARRLHVELGLETLEDLEVAAHDGRLDALPGFGARRTQAVRDLVGAILSRSTRRRARRIRDELEPDRVPLEVPSVATLLAVDQEYLLGADAGALP
jgi:DNA polymerase/3'-5' exonuclease PolX